jgi:hypothetical protein
LPKCRKELTEIGVKSENIVDFDCEKAVSFEEIRKYDALYFA